MKGLGRVWEMLSAQHRAAVSSQVFCDDSDSHTFLIPMLVLDDMPYQLLKLLDLNCCCFSML